MKLARTIAIALLLAGPASPSTWIVDDNGGPGLVANGATVTRSGAAFAGELPGYCGGTGVAVSVSGGVDTQLVPDAPTIAMSGLPVPGSSVTWTVYAEPGSTVELILGRAPIVLPVPGILIEQLTTALRTYDLGVVPASGQVERTIALPSAWPLGTRLVAQGRVQYPSIGETRHTSSSALIAR